MSRNKVFAGPLAEHLRGLLEEKRSLGYKYEEQARLMSVLDEMSKQYDCSEELSRELCLAFVERKPNWRQATQEGRVALIRILAEYMIRHDAPAYLIDSNIVTNQHENFKPYIFTHKQISDIFAVADKIKPNGVNSHVFYPTMLRVQYGCGLRISETLGLRMKDVDLDCQLLHVINAKNNKDRNIPVDDSVIEYMKWYKRKVHSAYAPEDYWSQLNIDYMMNMTKEFLSGKIDGIAYTLDFPYELEKRYKKMHREDDDYCELIYECLYEEGIAMYNELSDADFKKLIRKQYNYIKKIAILISYLKPLRKEFKMIELIATRIDIPVSDRVYEDLLDLVSYEKKLRIKRFKFLDDAKRTLFADLLVRYWLCNNFKLKNNDIKFKVNDYGKPYFDGIENVFFNVSHSTQWIICGFSNSEIGVDIEQIKNAHLDIAKRFYSQEEYADLLRKPISERNKYFFDLWTLKESYIKYKGKGFYIPLDSFSIKIQNNKVNIISEDLKRPNFQRHMINDNYMVAICSDSEELAKISYLTIEEIWNEFY